MAALLRIPGDVGFAQSPVPDACLCSSARMLSRYVSRPLDRFLAGSGLTITEFQIVVILREGPARVVPLACRLRLDPGHISRALARLEQREFVRRALRFRLAEWILERAGSIYLEVLEPGWLQVNEGVQRSLGPELPWSLVRVVDSLRYPVRRKHQGWSDDD